MKRKILAVSLVLICLSLSAFGTAAFFTAQKTAKNVITTGNVHIEILEWADNEKTVPFPEKGLKNIMPGTEVTKVVQIKNTGSAPAFIRVYADKAISGAKGEPDLSLIKPSFNTENWTEGEDGYYYYNDILAPGQITEPVFTSVLFEKNMDNSYAGCEISVEVKAYAVQSANNGTDPLAALGWPEITEG